jgi:hypothetical protein
LIDQNSAFSLFTLEIDSISIVCIQGDSITSVSTSTSLQHRRQISGFVNNHRSVPPITSTTPPRRSSTNEQQLMSATQRLSLTKPITMINHDNTTIQSPTKM